ncbi:MAG: helix-turn-helix transcriptional regulator [Alphaproteobacteria bacterium]|nr:helix-turn-helix transcriptional regulator [Alphaproteobacteria bacterium]
MTMQLHGLLASLPRRWLEARGHPPPDGGAPGTIGRETQRALLEAVASLGGEGALLALSRGVLTAVDEPLVYALLNVASVEALIDKEQRLNRFFHSHHRVRVVALGPGHLTLQHESRADAPPARVESLFVLGLHLTLLDEIGCHHVQATLPASDDPDAVVFREGGVRPPLPPGDASRWRFTWSRFVARRAWTPGLDEVLERASTAPDLDAPVPVATRVADVVARDLLHRWTVEEVARRLGRSRRALQRALSEEGTTFSRTVEDARLAEAERLLTEPDRSITEIGFTCGFADTAHFSRRFKARRARTPTTWRQQQAGGPRGAASPGPGEGGVV